MSQDGYDETIRNERERNESLNDRDNEISREDENLKSNQDTFRRNRSELQNHSESEELIKKVISGNLSGLNDRASGSRTSSQIFNTGIEDKSLNNSRTQTNLFTGEIKSDSDSFGFIGFSFSLGVPGFQSSISYKYAKDSNSKGHFLSFGKGSGFSKGPKLKIGWSLTFDTGIGDGPVNSIPGTSIQKSLSGFYIVGGGASLDVGQAGITANSSFGLGYGGGYSHIGVHTIEIFKNTSDHIPKEFKNNE